MGFCIAVKLEQKYHRLTSKFLVMGVFQAENTNYMPVTCQGLKFHTKGFTRTLLVSLFYFSLLLRHYTLNKMYSLTNIPSL